MTGYFKKLIGVMVVIGILITGCGSAPVDRGSIEAKANQAKEWIVDGADSNNNNEGEQKNAYDHIYVESNVAEGNSWDGVTKKDVYEGTGFSVTFELSDHWEGGYVANVTIKNTGDKAINNWGLEFELPGMFSNFWNAELSRDGAKCTFKAVDWNAIIEVGQTAEFGINGEVNFPGFPGGYVLYEYGGAVSQGGGAGSDTSVTPTATPAPGATAAPADTDITETADDDIPDAEEVKGSQVKAHGRLKVKGRFIVDKKGRKFLIKGPSTHGIAWFPEFVNKAAFKTCKKWGANTVRLACYSSEGEGYNTDSVWKTIDKGVKAASELGMYVIIDWHILNENKPMMSYDRAKIFFNHFAQKYGKKKNVIWEICNEPNGCEWAADIKPYAKKIIPLIRKYSKNIIVVGTPTWSQDVDVVAQDRLTGKYKKNVCYTLHFYAATHKDDLRNRVKTAISKGLPILCTEFSICEASGAGTLDTASGNEWIKLLRKNGIGYVSWSLCNKDEAASLLLPSCTRTGGFKKGDLSPTGKWVVKKW